MIYEKRAISEALKGNSYPGRGIVLGCSEDGSRLSVAYFIMGRSQNSRNRVFEEEGDAVTIYPADATKVEDPSLIIYSPIRVLGESLIVSNGDQTDTIYDFIKEGNTFEEALSTREFEPDMPNWTPRISGIMDLSYGSYTMSILKSEDSDGKDCVRYYYNYKPQKGLGHFIHTYVQDGSPIPSFQGEPIRISIPNTAEELASEIWGSLDSDNKIALYVRYINIADRTDERVLINRYDRVN